MVIQLHQRSSVVVFAALLWLLAYTVHSVSAASSIEELDIVNVRRLMTTGVGALVLLAAIRAIAKRTRSLISVLPWLAACVISVLCARLIYNLVSTGMLSTAGYEQTWLLIWIGYFTAWLLGAVLMEPRPVARDLPSNGIPRFADVGATRVKATLPLWHGRQMAPALKRFLKSQVFGVRRDYTTGHLYYMIEGKRCYIRSAEECERPHHRQYALNHIYFEHYRPSGTDVVVDFGAGLGSEILGLSTTAPDIRYFGVEVQPSVYECLSLTLSQLTENYQAVALAVGDAKTVHITPTRAGIDASLAAGGPVAVEGITWDAFCERFAIRTVDLLKMNVEGAEGDLLDHINLNQVNRVIVSTHDFKADRGEGEHYRTRSRVVRRLSEAGFELTPIHGEKDFMRSWIFASRRASR